MLKVLKAIQVALHRLGSRAEMILDALFDPLLSTRPVDGTGAKMASKIISL